MDDLLRRKREVLSDWLIIQSEKLLKLAREGSHTALIYAALEARNAIERAVFELIVTGFGRRLSERELRDCQKKDGVFKVLKRAIPSYRRHIEFTNIVLEEEDAPHRAAELDIAICKRHWQDLAQYCHFIADPEATLDAELDSWLSAGIATVEKATQYLRNTLTGKKTAVIHPSTMPPETKDTFEKFLAGELDRNEVRMRIRLLQPALRLRMLPKL